MPCMHGGQKLNNILRSRSQFKVSAEQRYALEWQFLSESHGKENSHMAYNGNEMGMGIKQWKWKSHIFHMCKSRTYQLLKLIRYCFYHSLVNKDFHKVGDKVLYKSIMWLLQIPSPTPVTFLVIHMLENRS